MRNGPHFQFVVHPLPGSAEQLAEKLREVGEKLRSHAASGISRSSPIVPGIPTPLSERGTLTGLPSVSGFSGSLGINIGARFDQGIGSASQVSQIEVGSSHFAFLLSDGRICRLPFSVISDRLDLTRSGSGSSNAPGGLSVGGGGSLATGALSGGVGPSSSKSAKTSHSSTAGKTKFSHIPIW